MPRLFPRHKCIFHWPREPFLLRSRSGGRFPRGGPPPPPSRRRPRPRHARRAGARICCPFSALSSRPSQLGVSPSLLSSLQVSSLHTRNLHHPFSGWRLRRRRRRDEMATREARRRERSSCSRRSRATAGKTAGRARTWDSRPTASPFRRSPRKALESTSHFSGESDRASERAESPFGRRRHVREPEREEAGREAEEVRARSSNDELADNCVHYAAGEGVDGGHTPAAGSHAGRRRRRRRGRACVSSAPRGARRASEREEERANEGGNCKQKSEQFSISSSERDDSRMY